MNKYKKILMFSVIYYACLFIAGNLLYYYLLGINQDEYYQTDLNRVVHTIETAGCEQVTAKQYSNLLTIDVLKADCEPKDMEAFFLDSRQNILYRYLVDASGENIYLKVHFRNRSNETTRQLLLNVLVAAGFGYLFVVLLYIGKMIVKPFHIISELPYELAKGNLVPDLKESKHKFFGRFLWGLELLRQKLEENRKRELSMERDKKLLILSISHDINTPVSAIKMSARAIREGLYPEIEKQKELALNIETNADKIEAYVNQIKQASKEEFLNFEILNSEFYLKALMDRAVTMYQERCDLCLTDFSIADYRNRLMYGDCDRMLEVLLNILDNALKYGDGKRIRITFDQEETYQLVHISNSGCSLNEKELVHVFESFYRGSNVGKKPGSGLGLYICKQLMSKMEGDIYIKVAGDTFIVTLVMKIV